MTTHKEEKRAAVPEYQEPTLGDKTRHVNESYTQVRREGALPVDVVVIPDMNSMYNTAENTRVFDLYEVGGLRGEEVSLPFVHGVELSGALVNAIDETLYLTLKGRLAALTPSEKILRMADGRRVVTPGGR